MHRNRSLLPFLVPALLIAILFAVASSANAQSTVTLTPSVTAGNGTLTTDVAWSTQPALTGPSVCQASSTPTAAQWNGPKAGSGSVTGLTFTADQRLQLVCTFAGDSIVTYTWVAPTLNTNGTPLTDLSGYRLKSTFGAALSSDPAVAAAGEFHVDVPAGQTTRTVTGISSTGTLRTAAYARAGSDPTVRWSQPSNITTKVFTGSVQVTQQVDLIVRSVPNAPATLGAQ